MRRDTARASEGDAGWLQAPDQRIVIHGVDWKSYVVTRELLDSPGLRMTYLQGALELMTPSPTHERNKTTIARLLEVFALERDVPLNGYGSTTFKNEAMERGLEPDECYVIGRGELGDAPDIAIEVVVTSGGLPKLEVYRGLGVREVWFFEDGAFHLHRLAGDGYQPIEGSELIPGLDLAELAVFAQRPDQHEAVVEYRDRPRRR